MMVQGTPLVHPALPWGGEHHNIQYCPLVMMCMMYIVMKRERGIKGNKQSHTCHVTGKRLVTWVRLVLIHYDRACFPTVLQLRSLRDKRF